MPSSEDCVRHAIDAVLDLDLIDAGIDIVSEKGSGNANVWDIRQSAPNVDDVNVRRALQSGIDREQIIDDLYTDSWRPARSVVTDGEGRYSITDLRPGTYIVTFSLEGFSTIRRGASELPSEFVMTLNADMRVGALEESITVTGAAPTVDVTTAAHNSVLNRDAIDSIPTGRTIQGMGQLIVRINLNLPDTGGARAMQQTYMSTHGMSSAHNDPLRRNLPEE